MRGHSGAVTGVRFLIPDTAARLVSGDTEEEAVVVSAGSDCSVRVWGVTSGACLRSIYTYNTVTRLGIIPHLCASVTTTDGGKLGENLKQIITTENLKLKQSFPLLKACNLLQF